MKKALIFGLALFAAQMSWAGGPDYSVSVDVDLCTKPSTPTMTICEVTLAHLPAIKNGNTSTPIRIPQFWDGRPVTLRFFFMGSEIQPPGPFNPELRMDLQFLDPDGVQSAQNFSTTWDFLPEDYDQLLAVSVTVDGLTSDVISPGKLYGFTVGAVLVNLAGTRTLSGVSLDFPVTLPFIYENGFESGNAAYWTEVMGSLSQ